MLSLANKMTDSMKFGPEWLRNLSQENSNTNCNNSSVSSSSTSTPSVTTTTGTSATVSMPRFQLAEHRYGREEMLALFDPGVIAPDSLKQINALYIEKTQTPLLLLQWTEEELRTWNRGINSDAVLRLAGKGGQGPGPSSVSGPGNIRGSLGGRGGSMDRGRGRGRGFHYNRGLSYDESDGSSGPPSSYSRSIRSYERDRVQGDRSSWTERNGDMESCSPRKDFNNPNREMSWRKYQEDESWRTTRHDKWVRGGGGGGGGGNLGGNSNNSNWRDDWDRGEPNHRSDNSRSRLWDEPNPNRPWDADDNLPEWATEKPSESGGSFDASGAFHGTNSDDDEENINSRVSKRKNREEDVHRADISSNNRVSSTNHSESNGIERHINGPLPQEDRLGDITSTKKGKDKPPQDHQSGGGGPPPLRQSHSTSSISSNLPPMRKSSAPSQQAQENMQAHPLTTSTSLSGMPVTKKIESSAEPDKTANSPLHPVVKAQVPKQHSPPLPSQPQPLRQQQPMQQQQPQPNLHPVSAPVHPVSAPIHPVAAPVLPLVGVSPAVSSLSSMKTEDTTEPEGMKLMQEVVAKLVDDCSVHVHPKPVPHAAPRASESDQWFYTDPQGEVQGPFSSAEMSEWYNSGYFLLDLMVRRADEKNFYPLGEHQKKYGKIPFLEEPVTTVPTPALPTLPEPTPVPPAARPNVVQEALLIHQQLQYQNFVLRQQQQALAVKTLSQSEHWNSLTPEQQILLRTSLEQNSFPPITATLPPSVPVPAPIPTTVENSALLIQKLQQAKAQADQLQQQQQQQLQQHQHPHLRHHQLPQQISQHLQEQPQPIVSGDTLLAGSVPRNIPQAMPPKTVENDSRVFDPVTSFLCQLQQNMALKQVDSVWSGPNAAIPTAAHQLPSWTTMPPLWGDVQPKMKTEQEILEEQRAEEARKKEELRKKTELNLKLKELKRQEEIAAAEEKKRRKKAEEEEAERKRKEQEAAERKHKKEEEEAKRKEAAAKKAEQERKKEEEKRRKEEEKKRKEEEKKRLEAEKRKQEEENKKLEEERKRKEEEIRRAEQARKQTEALKRLQEQAKVSPPWAPPPPPSTSLSEILKTERKQQQQLKEQQQQQLQLEAQARNQSSSKMQLKWAEQKLPVKVKSLAEIQAEEQENLAKQVEKERSTTSITTGGGIWSGQNLTWTNHSNPASVWGNSTAATGSSSGPGFWDDVTSVSKNQVNQKNVTAPTVQSTKSNGGKTKTKKEEAVVMKLFEQPKPHSDEFFQWCTKALSRFQSNLDVPTFVAFLRDIESEDDVREYIRLYLGDLKETRDFAAKFIERRSKMLNSTIVENNSSVPTLTTANHFQEVKGKSKKPKKSKMLRVDNKILGFNVTAAQDRINVGDRDYGDGI